MIEESKCLVFLFEILKRLPCKGISFVNDGRIVAIFDWNYCVPGLELRIEMLAKE